MYLVTHGDHGTSVSDKIVQKTKNVVNSRFFLRIFFPAHFNHWKLRKSLLLVVVVGKMILVSSLLIELDNIGLVGRPLIAEYS